MGVEAVDVAGGATHEGPQGGAFVLPSLDNISADLNNKEASIVLKMSHLFALRAWGGPTATQLLIQALKHRNIVDSVLFRHEAAYVLGQLGSPSAVSFLEETLNDRSEDEMVRHEAAEALAAIGSEQSLKTLSAYLEDPSLPVQETCQLAVYSLKHKCQQEQNDEQKQRKSCFNTVDPSQPFEGCTAADVPSMFRMLMDPKEPLWTRYRALFTLRDLRVPAAVAAVARALRHDHTSALLRHEIAFVLGQIQFPSFDDIEQNRDSNAPNSAKASVQTVTHTGKPDKIESPPTGLSAKAAASEAADALVNCLQDSSEHPMARHEAALALGSLGADARAETCYCRGQSVRDIAVSTLKAHCECTDKVVAESCLVALSNMQEELNIHFGV